jgi:hypothetical protein
LLSEVSDLNSARPRAGETIKLRWPIDETFAFPQSEAGA